MNITTFCLENPMIYRTGFKFGEPVKIKEILIFIICDFKVFEQILYTNDKLAVILLLNNFELCQNKLTLLTMYLMNFYYFFSFYCMLL